MNYIGFDIDFFSFSSPSEFFISQHNNRSSQYIHILMKSLDMRDDSFIKLLLEIWYERMK